MSASAPGFPSSVRVEDAEALVRAAFARLSELSARSVSNDLDLASLVPDREARRAVMRAARVLNGDPEEFEADDRAAGLFGAGHEVANEGLVWAVAERAALSALSSLRGTTPEVP